MRRVFFFFSFFLFSFLLFSQDITRKDSLRGNLTPLRTCYDVTFYDLNIAIDEQDKLFPSYGSGANGLKTGNGYISRAEFIDLLKYANDRNITVIPQISFPSHARAAIKSMRARYNKLSKADKTADAEKYLLDDINDKRIYDSAQANNDNIK